MHDFDTAQKNPGAAKSLKSAHQSSASVDHPVILFNNIVDILGLADLDRQSRDRRSRRAARRGQRRSCPTLPFWEQYSVRWPSRRTVAQLPVPLRSKQEVNRVTRLVDDAIEICPFAADLDVRFVHPSNSANGWAVAAKRLLQNRRRLDGRAVHRQIIDINPAFDHHLRKKPQAQRISHVPTARITG